MRCFDKEVERKILALAELQKKLAEEKQLKEDADRKTMQLAEQEMAIIQSIKSTSQIIQARGKLIS